MNLYHIKLTDNQKNALNYLFAQDIKWNKTELEKAWHDLREQLKESVQCVAIIDALQDSGCNCKKPTEPAPKYDPCRLFKKGDKVRVVEWNGRDIARVGQIGYVVSDERNSKVELAIDGWTKDVYYPACHLELVTPVEELEPYLVAESTDGATIVLTVKKRGGSQGLEFRYCPGWGGNIFFSENHCRKHAEAERDRLNAEYRKERS